MAGPITHTVFAEKVLVDLVAGKDKPQFIVGNLFPDIRYLGVIDRQVAHYDEVTIDDVRQETDSFKSGVLFHSLVDKLREDIIIERKIYADMPKGSVTARALKVCEDMRLYSESDNWKLYASFLNEVYPQEVQFKISEKDVQCWHNINSALFNQASLTNYATAFARLGFDQKQIIELFNLVKLINERRLVDSYIDNLYADIKARL